MKTNQQCLEMKLEKCKTKKTMTLAIGHNFGSMLSYRPKLWERGESGY